MIVINNQYVPPRSHLDSPEYAFVSTMLWMSRWSRKVFAPFGLQGVHFHTMARLMEQPGQTQRELGESIHRDAPSTTRVLDEMIAMGLVERRVDPDDRRCRRVFLNRKGKRVFAKVSGRMMEERAAISDDIPEADVRALWRVAQHLQDRFRSALGRTETREREAG